MSMDGFNPPMVIEFAITPALNQGPVASLI